MHVPESLDHREGTSLEGVDPQCCITQPRPEQAGVTIDLLAGAAPDTSRWLGLVQPSSALHLTMPMDLGSHHLMRMSVDSEGLLHDSFASDMIPEPGRSTLHTSVKHSDSHHVQTKANAQSQASLSSLLNAEPGVHDSISSHAVPRIIERSMTQLIPDTPIQSARHTSPGPKSSFMDSRPRVNEVTSRRTQGSPGRHGAAPEQRKNIRPFY